MKTLNFLAAAALAAVSTGSAHAAGTPPLSPLQQQAADLRFVPGEKAPFLGLFTHLEPYIPFADKLASLERLIARNPHIAGVTLKIQWKQLHPAKNTYDWEGLERLVATAAAAGKLVNFALIPGAASPDWIYSDGVHKAGPLEFGRQNTHVPLPWDRRFMELYTADLRLFAERYAGDPRIFQIEVLGHNYNPGGEEMHAPTVEAMKPYDWSKEKVLENWKYWVDLYATLFPRQKLSLVVSQMYRGSGMELPEKVAAYFVERCAGRAVLQTHQLTGRIDRVAESGQICAEHARLAPSSHEAVLSFKETPERQGTPAMTLYNARQGGDNLLYFQFWRRDCEDPKYAQAFAEAWEKYGRVPLGELKARLTADGLYVPPETREPPAAPYPAPRKN